MVTQKPLKTNLPVDLLMRRMSREVPVIVPITPQRPSATPKKEDTLKLQEEWRIFNIQRQAKGLKPLGFETFLQLRN